jgi:glyoxylase-like metal-dependent hydrolase (beta-lactamase superfamily II)
VWGPGWSPQRLVAHWIESGLPADQIDDVIAESTRLGAGIGYAESPHLLDPGDEVDGWHVELLRGHADGHIALFRDDVKIAGDTIIEGITPAIGLYPNARPDPLADYFVTLGRIEELAPRVAYAGHHAPFLDPAARAREIREHHAERLAAATAALDVRPRTAYEVSLALFPQDLPSTERRFAIAESLAHLEYLAAQGEVARNAGGYVRAR